MNAVAAFEHRKDQLKEQLLAAKDTQQAVLQLFSCCNPVCTTLSVWWTVALQGGLLGAVLQWVLWLAVLWVSLVLSTKSFWYSAL